jgi:hypothetical protein
MQAVATKNEFEREEEARINVGTPVADGMDREARARYQWVGGITKAASLLDSAVSAPSVGDDVDECLISGSEFLDRQKLRKQQLLKASEDERVASLQPAATKNRESAKKREKIDTNEREVRVEQQGANPDGTVPPQPDDPFVPNEVISEHYTSALLPEDQASAFIFGQKFALECFWITR